MQGLFLSVFTVEKMVKPLIARYHATRLHDCVTGGEVFPRMMPYPTTEVPHEEHEKQGNTTSYRAPSSRATCRYASSAFYGCTVTAKGHRSTARNYTQPERNESSTSHVSSPLYHALLPLPLPPLLLSSLPIYLHPIASPPHNRPIPIRAAKIPKSITPSPQPPHLHNPIFTAPRPRSELQEKETAPDRPLRILPCYLHLAGVCKIRGGPRPH